MGGLRAIIEHREVLRMLVLRDLQRQYTRFRLGYLWTILEPLGMSIVLWFVFSVLLGARALGLQPYLLFLTFAILPWWWFTNGVRTATRAFRKPSKQVRVSVLPREIWVMRGVLVTMVEFLLSLPVALLAMALTRTLPGPYILLLPVGMALELVLLYGLSLLIATWTTLVPDLARTIRIVVRIAFYLSPILYSISNIPENLRFIVGLNPMVAVLGLYRIGFWPEEVESIGAYALSLGICAGTFVAGVLVFRRLEGRVLKEL